MVRSELSSLHGGVVILFFVFHCPPPHCNFIHSCTKFSHFFDFSLLFHRPFEYHNLK